MWICSATSESVSPRASRALRNSSPSAGIGRTFAGAPGSPGARSYDEVQGNMSERERVVAAMSGGVDSAVAAGLLAEAGYDVVGVTMKMYAPTKPAHAKSCCGADDFDDARRTAAALDVPHYVLDFEEAFERHVVARFAADYRAGRTPTPCVSCNNFVKLGTLSRFADRLGARYVATGHYARLVHETDGPHLYAG